MSRIRGKDTTPEKIVRSLLHRLGYRFRLHVRLAVETPLLGERVATGRVRADRKSPIAAPRSALRAPRFVRPDILLPKHKTAIFVHGCFWHRH
jgi:DNA mismatch endonuclease (patch repair protein)